VGNSRMHYSSRGYYDYGYDYGYGYWVAVVGGVSPSSVLVHGTAVAVEECSC